LDLGRRQCRTGNKLEGRISSQLPCQPQKGFLKIVVTLGRDIKVLEVFLAMECDSLCFDLAIFDVDLVAAEDDGNVLANTNKVT